MKIKYYALAATLGAIAISGTAQAAENLDCITSGYGDEQRVAFDEFITSYRFEDAGDIVTKAYAKPTLKAIFDKSEQCKANNGWNDKALEQALIHQLARLTLLGLEKNAPFNAATWSNIRREYANADRRMLRRFIFAVDEDSILGEKFEALNKSDEDYLLKMMMRTGVHKTANGPEYLGGWLAAKLLIEISAEKFAEA